MRFHIMDNRFPLLICFCHLVSHLETTTPSIQERRLFGIRLPFERIGHRLHVGHHASFRLQVHERQRLRDYDITRFKELPYKDNQFTKSLKCFLDYYFIFHTKPCMFLLFIILFFHVLHVFRLDLFTLKSLNKKTFIKHVQVSLMDK